MAVLAAEVLEGADSEEAGVVEEEGEVPAEVFESASRKRKMRRLSLIGGGR